MNFVFPSFLWALAALSIPVIIHLFNFRRVTRVMFSNTRLLHQIRQETTQQRNIKRWLVLAARLLFLLFLVLAFAQPFIPAKEQMTAGKNIVIYLDNSFSMSGQVNDKLRALDEGEGFVREIAETFPADSRYRLITNDFAPFSNTFKTRSELIDLLSQLRLSPVSRTFEEVKQRIGGQSRTDIFFISDFQKSTFGEKNTAHEDSVNQWHLIPISLGQASNVFIDSVYLDNPLMIGGSKNIVRARIHNAGTKRSDGLIVKLTLDGAQAATAAAVIEPNSDADLSFELNTRFDRQARGRLSFNDFPISFDNEFFFTLDPGNRINVIEIKAKPDAGYLAKVYGNSQFFKFTSFGAGNVNFGLLDAADLVIINGVEKIDNVLGAALDRYNTRFGTILFIPGEHPEIASWKRASHLAGLSLAPANSSSENLDRPDLKNPFFENVFEDRSTLLTMPNVKNVLALGPDRSAILKLKNGDPYLVKNGNIFVMASPLDRAYTDIFTQAIFVPMMYKIAVSGKKNDARAYYSLNETLISIKGDSISGEEPLKLIGEQEVVPAQRRLEDRILMDVPRFAVTPGFYNVVHARDTVGLVAFDLNRQESLIDQYTGEEAKTMLGGGTNVSIFQSSSQGSFSNEIKERYLGTPLWKHALILSLLFLLAEVLLIRFLK